MIRKLTEEELKYENIINKDNFPEAINLDSDAFLVRKELLENNDWIGLFDEDEQLVSVVDIVLLDDHIDIGLLETTPEEQGKGYSSKLIKYIFKEYEDKYDYVEVDCLYSDLEKFYNKFGFTVVKDKTMKTMRRQL